MESVGEKMIKYKNPSYMEFGFACVGNKYKNGVIKEDYEDGCLLVIDSLGNEEFINKKDVINL